MLEILVLVLFKHFKGLFISLAWIIFKLKLLHFASVERLFIACIDW